MMVKRGTLIDATLVAASVVPPRDTQSAPGEGSELDPDADWTRRKGGGGSHFGYKAHLAVDQGSGLIRKALLTSAKVNDSEVADALICGDEQTVYADKAYDSNARRELLARMGIGDGIMRRARWGTARRPDPALVERNLSLSPIRSAVERSFAAMKQWYGYRRVRYRGLASTALRPSTIPTPPKLPPTRKKIFPITTHSASSHPPRLRKALFKGEDEGES